MKIIPLTDQSQYENFLLLHPNTSFLQSWAWGEFQNTQGKKPYRFGLVDEENKIISCAQFLLTTIPGLKGQYLYCARGPIGKNNVNEFVNGLKKYLLAQSFKAWFIKYEPASEITVEHSLPSSHVQPGKTLVTDLSLSEDELLNLMHHKTRYNIKVAEKHEVKVELHNRAGTYDEQAAINLLVATSVHQGYRNHSRTYFENLLEYFHGQNPANCKLIVATAYVNEHLTAAAILIDYNETRTYLFGGSDYSYRQAMAPYLMHWTATQDAKKLGLNFYDWWGIETSDGKQPGFVRFKLGWRGHEINYPKALELPLRKFPHQLYRVSKSLANLIKL